MSEIIYVTKDVLERLRTLEERFQQEEAAKKEVEAEVEAEGMTSARIKREAKRAPAGEWVKVHTYKNPRTATSVTTYWRSRMSGKWLANYGLGSYGSDMYVFKLPKIAPKKGGK